MVTLDTTYFLSNPVFGAADENKWANTYHFLGDGRFEKEHNYSPQEVENILHRANRRLNKKRYGYTDKKNTNIQSSY